MAKTISISTDGHWSAQTLIGADAEDDIVVIIEEDIVDVIVECV